MASIAVLLGVTATALSLTMALTWAAVVRLDKSAWVDPIWSLAVGSVGFSVALAPTGDGLHSRQTLVAALVLLWSLRLGLHLAWRAARNGRDPRYIKLRRTWGQDYRRKFFWFLQMQAGAAWILATCTFLAAHNPASMMHVGDWLATGLVLVAIAGEATADQQLATFRKLPDVDDRVCDIGMWKYSRHPNYFFEWLAWVGFALFALYPEDRTYPLGWIALSGPSLMYWLLVHASGVPPLEEHMLATRGRAFRQYQLRVNRFWPGPPRNYIPRSSTPPRD